MLVLLFVFLLRERRINGIPTPVLITKALIAKTITSVKSGIKADQLE